ncbi:hypothetical protein WR25_24000 [Diploscapter pachys]|uniref:Ubiquitin-like domain-containing protein n=1 Tax=Diploscapter pachys TaxID=2018661 RepID=A0A2A2KQU1_9BILA|nr:hypothetical protein WR25_24000 [Diploscapter pachys]
MTLEVDAEEDDTFKDLKWRIKDKLRVRPIDQLHITHPPHPRGKPLPKNYEYHRVHDHMRLVDFQAGEWAERDMELDVKYREPTEIRFFVETPDDKMLALKMNDNSTVSLVKRKIHDIEGPKHCHRLLTLKGQPLLRYHRLFEYGLEDGMLLKLIEPNFGPITITAKFPFGSAWTLKLKGESTIEEVKQMLYETQGIPTDIPKLIYTGRRGTLEDIYSLAEYGIKNDDSIIVTYSHN